jgi:hypothetical protein
VVVQVWDHEERSHKFVCCGQRTEKNGREIVCKECIVMQLGIRRAKAVGRREKKERLRLDGCPGRAGLVLC